MKTILIIPFLVVCYATANCQTNRYTKPVENNLRTYEPNTNMGALYGLAIEAQLRRNKEAINSFREYYKAFQQFKKAEDGTYKAVLIFNNQQKEEYNVYVRENKIYLIDVSGGITSKDGLKVPNEINNAYSKVFLEAKGQFITIEIYLPSLFGNN